MMPPLCRMNRQPLPRTLRQRLRPPRPLSWCRRLERVLRWDPNRRGLVSDRDLGILGHVRGDLQRASRRLARPHGRAVIVTGFPVRGAGQLRPETDGPPGAVLLGAALAEVGWQVVLVTDRLCAGVLERCAEEVRRAGAVLQTRCVEEVPAEREAAVQALYDAAGGRRVGVVIAVERPGPAHRPETALLDGERDPVFEAVVPESHWGKYHNCRGEPITGCCAAFDRWFELERPAWFRVGVGDGGNEIGMGRIPWRLLQISLRDGLGGLIACRTPADSLILAGVSNWGAYGLALAVAACAARPLAARWITPAWECRLVDAALAAGAVDGLTGRAEPLVDGQPLELHGQLIRALRRVFRLPA